MDPASRIFVNTAAQYVRTIINVVLSLYSSRLVLHILGVEDFGIYALVSGVVSMLSFITNSLVTSTQRFLSVNQGKGDIENLKNVFANSLGIHILLGFFIAILLEILTPFIFDGFLNIPEGRIGVARKLYQCVVIMVYISFIAAPYRSLLVSRENIVYVSFVDVLDGILKVALVTILPYLACDKLFAYGCVMLLVQVLNLMLCACYSHIKYEEAIIPHIKMLSLSCIKELMSFTSWMIYSTVCITAKSQGLAIVLNRALGAVINAAYGIGGQVAGMMAFVGSSLNNAIAPQLMSAEGRNDRDHMFALAETESRLSFLLLSMVGIPTMFEMSFLLRLWLGEDVPDYTMLFTCMFILAQILDMLSSGLALANKAIGNVAYYTLMTYTPKILVLPLGWLLIKFAQPLWSVCLVYVLVEFLCSLIRILLFRRDSHFNILSYFSNVIVKTQIPVIISVLACALVRILFDGSYRFIITYIFSCLLFAITTYFIVLTQRERSFINNLISRFRKSVSRT